MPEFSDISKKKLLSCHEDLQILFTEVVKHFDCTVLYGHRSSELQFKLFMKGREVRGNEIVIVDKKKVVTYKDGSNKMSKHNYKPSRAIDIAPYPVDWKDTDRMRYFAGFVIGIAKILKSEGKIFNDIVWGGDWDSDTDLDDQTFFDGVHFQIK